jgi:hypothetical protein
MQARRLLRLSGWAGVGFLVLDVVGQVLAVPADGKVNEPIATVVGYYVSHRHQMINAVAILAVAGLCLTWFLGALYQFLRTTTEADDPLPGIVLVSGSVVTGLFLLERVPQVVLSLMAGQPGGLSTGPTVRALADLQAVLTTALFVTAAVLVPALSIGLVRRRVVGPWLSWVGGASAALFLASGLAGYASIDNAAWGVVLHLGDLGLAVIVVVAAIALIRLPNSTATRESTAVATVATT